jgi:hypothetical protein
MISEHTKERNLVYFPSCESAFERYEEKQALPKEISEIVQLLRKKFPSGFSDFHSHFS